MCQGEASRSSRQQGTHPVDLFGVQVPHLDHLTGREQQLPIRTHAQAGHCRSVGLPLTAWWQWTNWSMNGRNWTRFSHRCQSFYLRKLFYNSWKNLHVDVPFICIPGLCTGAKIREAEHFTTKLKVPKVKQPRVKHCVIDLRFHRVCVTQASGWLCVSQMHPKQKKIEQEYSLN